MKICSIDVGTTRTKVIIFDQEGRILASLSQEYPVLHPKDGWAQQDANLVFETIIRLAGNCIHNANLCELDALALSVQGDAVIPADKNGLALHYAILGMDYRSEEQAEQCARELGSCFLFEKTGMRPHPINSAAKIMWIQQKRPDIASQVHQYLTYDGYILKRLGADSYVIDLTMASRSMMCSLKDKQWDGAILEALNIERNTLPVIVSSGTVTGKLERKLAEKLHLKNQPYLITGGHDQTCAGVGAGAVISGVAADSHGTAEVLSAGFKEPPSLKGMYDGFYPCYCHSVPGQYFTFALNHCGGIVFKWFRDHFSEGEIAQGKAQKKSAYDIMADNMDEAPSNLLFLPHLNGSGTPYCNVSFRGSILGLTFSTAKEEIGKALLEGLSYELKLNALRFRQIGIPVEDIRCVGGGASHPSVLQMKADILGQPVSTMKNTEAASLGAAIIALNRLGHFKTLQEGAAHLAMIEKTYYPQPKQSRAYENRFELYSSAYHSLEPIYKGWENHMRKDL